MVYRCTFNLKDTKELNAEAFPRAELKIFQSVEPREPVKDICAKRYRSIGNT